ncbi:MAG: M14 metallopeptidase family protein, partial [Bacteroidota bacterium]
MTKTYSIKFHLLTFLFTFLLAILSWAQASLDYYLPDNVSYQENIPTPHSVLGYQIGEWHLSHDQLVMYVKAVAAASDRVTVEEIGRTYERRPQLLLTITSPPNQQHIDKIKNEHKQLSNPAQSGSLDTQDMPVVVQLGYTVHGNEASGANASALVVYYLAAAQGKAIDDLLDKVVILLDPCFNPDGMQRFSTWVNMHKSKNLVSDPSSREYNEVFPRGRTNHYWFDLNRDWLLLQHPESRARIAKYQEWRPNILTDHHEMGSNSTFFFQPGIPSRTNPLTPAKNQELTTAIGKFHAKALDKINSLYMTKEIFDDFYYGKGSSYPDAQGSIGILFEQASSRGHYQETDQGILTFPFAIRNHFTASLSTLEAAQALRKELLDYQKDFFRNAPREKASYVFGSSLDPARNFHLVDILLRHEIEVRKLDQDFNPGQERFKAHQAYVVSLDQAQVRLIKGIFQTQTKFKDSLFYDVSTWTLPLAFNLPYTKVNNIPSSEPIEAIPFPVGQLQGPPSQVGYVFNCHAYYTPRALHHLLKKGVKVRVATQEAQVSTSEGPFQMKYGAIFIPVGIQDMESSDLFSLLQELAKENALDIFSLSS